MSNFFRKNDFRVTALASIFSLVGLSCPCLGSFAQTAIAPDTTLPVNTLVNFNNTDKTYTITGGTQVGTNQFHSFQDFSVPSGNTAHFDSVLTTTNVIGRVTGSNISNIDGTLKTNGSTNLYLINPNGIIFGADAKLDIAGSFSASTANSIKFSDGSEFSATNPQAPPLLQVSIPSGLQYGQSKVGATIKSNGSLTAGQDLGLNADKLDLAGILKSSRDLKLQAQDSISITNGVINTNSSGVGNAGNIAIDARSLYLNNSSINANTFGKGNGGNITINVTDSIKLDGKSSVESQVANPAEGEAGNLKIDANTLELLGGSFLASSTLGQGNAGNITIDTKDKVEVSGIGSAVRSTVEFGGVGNAGTVTVNAGSLSLQDGAQLSASTSGKGYAGDVKIIAEGAVLLSGANSGIFSVVNLGVVVSGKEFGSISIDAESLSILNGAKVSTSTSWIADVGDVDITVRDKVQVSGVNSGIFSTVETTGISNAIGTVTIKAGSLSVTDNAEISTSTAGKGDAGNIIIDAQDKVEVSGIGSAVRSTVGFGAAGNAGFVRINTGFLSLKDEAHLSSSTSGTGYAGDIEISTSGAVSLSGTNTGIFSTVNSGVVVSGRGFGSISIDAESLSILNGAKVSASTSGIADVGDISIGVRDKVQISGIDSGIFNTIQTTGISKAIGTVSIRAGSLYVTDNAQISANTSGKGNAGTVNINVTDFIKFDGKSLVQSQVLGEGNGGNINVSAKTLEFLGISSFLVSNLLGKGNAGNINITVTDFIKFDGQSSVQTAVLFGEGGGGAINVSAKTLELLGSSFFSSSTVGQGNAGNITINVADSIKFDGKSYFASESSIGAKGNSGSLNVSAKTLELLGDSTLTTNVLGEGNAGNITINVADFIKFDGKSSVQSQVTSIGVGNAGNLKISAKTLSFLGGSLLATSTFGKGNAGNITITAKDKVEGSGINSVVRTTVQTGAVGNAGVVSIDTGSLAFTDGAQISTSTSAKGNAGNITITAKGKVDLSGSPDTDSNNSSGVFSRVETGANGNAGTISITANSLSVKDGARITARTAAQGNAGNVIIKVADALVISGLQNDVPSRISSSVNVGGVGDAGSVIIEAKSIAIADSLVVVSSRTEGEGNAGNVDIKAETLNIRNGGSISTSTATNGNGGNINIILSKALFLDGNGSLITAGTTGTSTGKGGSILIDPPLVSITNGAVISVNSLGQGNGGSLNIVADKFIFANNAALFANTASGEGGNINLKITDIFFPRNNSNITATAGGTGNGGNISLSSLFMIAVPSENSDLFANAFFGKGGQIDITTNGLFGLEFRSRQTPFSDITASSEFGIQGTVSITTPGVDPSKGLSNLPVDTSDASKLVAEKCLADRQGSSFVITGRGGVPASPFDTISAVNIPDHLGSISNQTANNTSNLVTSRSANSSDRLPHNIPDRIVEAQGWIINSQGQVSLVAQAPATPAPVWSNQPKCK